MTDNVASWSVTGMTDNVASWTVTANETSWSLYFMSVLLTTCRRLSIMMLFVFC